MLIQRVMDKTGNHASFKAALPAAGERGGGTSPPPGLRRVPRAAEMTGQQVDLV